MKSLWQSYLHMGLLEWLITGSKLILKNDNTSAHVMPIALLVR